MRESQHRTRRGAHRTGRDAAATLLTSLLAVLAITAVITALYVWSGEDVEPSKASIASQKPETTPSAISAPATPTATPSSSAPKTSATSKPAPSPSATKEAAKKDKKKSTTRKTTTSKTETPVSQVGVVVLNQTSRSGLAASVAARLRAQGWTVIAVGNFRGVVPATTVYYPAGQQAAALSVAAHLPTPPRVRPRFGNLSTARLTVVVTTNYPS